jgi:2,4-dienoyl-CoA reductase (NADPH2)
MAVIGADGIGFDVTEFRVEAGHSPTLDLATWNREWGIADPQATRAGLTRPQRPWASGWAGPPAGSTGQR